MNEEHNDITEESQNNRKSNEKINLFNTKKKRIILSVAALAIILCIVILAVKPLREKAAETLKLTFKPTFQTENNDTNSDSNNNSTADGNSDGSDLSDTVNDDQRGNDVTGLTNDYEIRNDTITFISDNGKNTIPCNLPKEDLDETKEFYGSDYSIPSSAFSIQGNTCAFWYGKEPKLYITNDNGASWKTVEFEAPKDMPDCTSRAVCFTDENNGFCALGTPYSMGNGEWNQVYVTNDGGASWKATSEVDKEISATIGDIAFADSLNGIVCYNSSSYTNGIPLTYCTTDGGKTYKNFKLPNYTDDIDLSNLYTENLEYADGVYTLTLGTNEVDNHKLTYTSTDLLNWTYVKMYTADIHSVG